MNLPAADLSLATSAPTRSWPARLKLTTGFRRGRTRVLEKQQAGPLTLQRAHYPEQDLAHLHLLHPPGGVVGGDTLDIEMISVNQSRSLVTTPGATKFYAGNGFPASQAQRLTISANTSLEWLPQENIIFDGADIVLSTEIHVESNASLVAWEINTFGRPASSQPYRNGSFSNRLRVYDSNRLIFQDMFVHDAKRDNLSSIPGLRGLYAMATMVVMPVERQFVAEIQAKFHDKSRALAATCLDDIMVVRCMGHSSAQLRNWLTQIWFYIRPDVIGREGMIPRIWNT